MGRIVPSTLPGKDSGIPDWIKPEVFRNITSKELSKTAAATQSQQRRVADDVVYSYVCLHCNTVSTADELRRRSKISGIPMLKCAADGNDLVPHQVVKAPTGYITNKYADNTARFPKDDRLSVPPYVPNQLLDKSVIHRMVNDVGNLAAKSGMWDARAKFIRSHRAKGPVNHIASAEIEITYTDQAQVSRTVRTAASVDTSTGKTILPSYFTYNGHQFPFTRAAVDAVSKGAIFEPLEYVPGESEQYFHGRDPARFRDAFASANDKTFGMLKEAPSKQKLESMVKKVMKEKDWTKEHAERYVAGGIWGKGKQGDEEGREKTAKITLTAANMHRCYKCSKYDQNVDHPRNEAEQWQHAVCKKFDTHLGNVLWAVDYPKGCEAGEIAAATEIDPDYSDPEQVIASARGLEKTAVDANFIEGILDAVYQPFQDILGSGQRVYFFDFLKQQGYDLTGEEYAYLVELYEQRKGEGDEHFRPVGVPELPTEGAAQGMEVTAKVPDFHDYLEKHQTWDQLKNLVMDLAITSNMPIHFDLKKVPTMSRDELEQRLTELMDRNFSVGIASAVPMLKKFGFEFYGRMPEGDYAVVLPDGTPEILTEAQLLSFGQKPKRGPRGEPYKDIPKEISKHLPGKFEIEEAPEEVIAQYEGIVQSEERLAELDAVATRMISQAEDEAEAYRQEEGYYDLLGSTTEKWKLFKERISKFENGLAIVKNKIFAYWKGTERSGQPSATKIIKAVSERWPDLEKAILDIYEKARGYKEVERFIEAEPEEKDMEKYRRSSAQKPDVDELLQLADVAEDQLAELLEALSD